MSFLCIACGTDDKNEDDITKTNHFLYEGKEYSLSKGFFDFSDESELSGAFLVDLGLYSSGINYDSIEDEFSGKGDGIIFGFYSSAKNELNSGTYTFDSSESGEVNTFDTGAFIVGIDIEVENDDIPESQYIISGTVKVNKTGEIYEFDMDCTLKNGKKVTGYYKGIIK